MTLRTARMVERTPLCQMRDGRYRELNITDDGLLYETDQHGNQYAVDLSRDDIRDELEGRYGLSLGALMRMARKLCEVQR